MIKRYEINSEGCIPIIENEKSDGEWVKFKDHQKIINKNIVRTSRLYEFHNKIASIILELGELTETDVSELLYGKEFEGQGTLVYARNGVVCLDGTFTVDDLRRILLYYSSC